MKESIVGDKVMLRALREEDAEFFTRWHNDPEIMFECGFSDTTTLESEINKIRSPEKEDRDWYAITDLSDKIIGETGFLRMDHYWHRTDMSMIIPNPEDQGKGYGHEAGNLMLDRAFRYYEFNRIAVGVVALNTPGLKYWESLGFRKEGIEEQGYYHSGEFSDFILMRILKSEYI